MASKKRHERKWTLGEKLNGWRVHVGTTWAAVSRKTGISKSTLNNWVSAGIRPTGAKFAPLARLTGYPIEYWLDESLRWPPPADYLDAAGDLDAAMSTMSVDELRAWLRILSDPAARRRALALWDASERDRS